jgi:hypothetical protein
MTNFEIQEKAEEIASKYKSMSFPLSVKKYSTENWTLELCKFLNPFNEPYKTQVREKFLSLVGLDGDQGKAQDKFLRDFPG